MKDQTVQQAIRDVQLIKKALGFAAQPNSQEIAKAQAAISMAATILALAVLIVELLTDEFGTVLLLASRDIVTLRTQGILEVGTFLLVISLLFHYLLKGSAKRKDEPLETFVSERFSYLRNFSLAADLTVKFAIFALIILARQPQLIAPMLLVFTSDYLFQGRFFQLPFLLSISLCLHCRRCDLHCSTVSSHARGYLECP